MIEMAPGDRSLSAEETLWIEVIKDAVRDILKRDKRPCPCCCDCWNCNQGKAGCPKQVSRYQCSFAWVKSADFEETCDMLCIDHKAIRRFTANGRNGVAVEKACA